MLNDYDTDGTCSLLWPEAIAALYTTDTIKAGWLSVCFHTQIVISLIRSDSNITLLLYRSLPVLVLLSAKSLLVS